MRNLEKGFGLLQGKDKDLRRFKSVQPWNETRLIAR